jgi:hypothetical protein
LDKARELGIQPGSRSLRHDAVDRFARHLVRGLALLEGCFPISQLNPLLYHLLHYGRFTQSHGILRWYWMFPYERFNKHMKDLCRNTQKPMATMAQSYMTDAATHFMDEAEGINDVKDGMRCELIGKETLYVLNKEEITDLVLLGECSGLAAVDIYFTATGYPRAKILDVLFHAGINVICCAVTLTLILILLLTLR